MHVCRLRVLGPQQKDICNKKIPPPKKKNDNNFINIWTTGCELGCDSRSGTCVENVIVELRLLCYVGVDLYICGCDFVWACGCQSNLCGSMTVDMGFVWMHQIWDLCGYVDLGKMWRWIRVCRGTRGTWMPIHVYVDAWEHCQCLCIRLWCIFCTCIFCKLMHIYGILKGTALQCIKNNKGSWLL